MQPDAISLSWVRKWFSKQLGDEGAEQHLDENALLDIDVSVGSCIGTETLSLSWALWPSLLMRTLAFSLSWACI